MKIDLSENNIKPDNLRLSFKSSNVIKPTNWLKKEKAKKMVKPGKVRGTTRRQAIEIFSIKYIQNDRPHDRSACLRVWTEICYALGKIQWREVENPLRREGAGESV